MKNKTAKIILWAVLIVILAFFPKTFGIYYTNVFVTFAVFAVYAVSLNVLAGGRITGDHGQIDCSDDGSHRSGKV